VAFERELVVALILKKLLSFGLTQRLMWCRQLKIITPIKAQGSLRKMAPSGLIRDTRQIEDNRRRLNAL